MKTRYKLTFTVLSWLLLSFFTVQAQYLATYFQDAGNPGGLNTLSDASTTGWTEILPPSQSANIWSAAEAVPFSFDFYGTTVTHFKASLNGIVTFDTTVSGTPPNANTNLPGSTLPNMSIANYWDEFTAAPPTGSNDRVYTQVFGTAPNQQLWIKWHSFEYGNPNISFAYIAVVLEESTNKIYLVDLYGSTTPVMTTTAGIQMDNSTAVQYGDSTLDLSGNGSSNSDNDYIELFVPPAVDLAVGEFLNLPTTALANSTVNFDVVVQNAGMDPVAGAMLDIWLNGSLSSSLPVATLASGEADTIAASVTASASGRDSLVAALQPVTGDANPANDTLGTAYDVVGAMATPFFEHFDSLDGTNTDTLPAGWVNATGDDFDWFPEETGVGNSSGTGPIADHSGSGNYMYTESSTPNFPDKVALLETPFIDLTGLSNPALIFWYHMFGATMGELHVDVFANGAWINDIRSPYVGQQQTAEDAPWRRTTADLSPWSGNTIKIRFRGITGSSFTSDMAIDDVSVDEAVFDIAANSVLDATSLSKMALTQTGIVSSISYSGNYENIGPDNSGDVNMEVTDMMSTVVFSDALTGVTINGYSDSTFNFVTWDASAAMPGLYDVTSFGANFTDTDPSNDTTYNSVELGTQLAYDDANHTNNVAIVSTNRNRLGTRFTLTDDDSLSSVSILITSSTTATDSFSIDIYEAAGDTPTVAFARVFRGTYGDFSPLPALVTFLVTPKLALSAGDFYAIIDSDSSGNSNFPLGASSSGPGARNIPRRFGGSSPGFSNNAWLFFEDAGNAAFHGFTPILRVGFQEEGEIHDYFVKSVSAQACMVAGETYDVKGVVENRGNQPETDVTIEFRENGVMIADVLLSLNPGEADTVTFSYTPANPGDFKLEIVSLLAGDNNPGNDVDSAFVSVLASGLDILFFDDFSDTTFTFANWIVTNDGGDGVWMVYEEPYPNDYTLPPTSSGNVLSADADQAGSGTTTLTTAILALDLSAYNIVGLNVDSDWRHIDTEDTARIKVSPDNGATWITVLEYAGATVRNEHISLDLSAQLANSVNALIAFQSIQPGWDWWWTIDNVCVTGDVSIPPPTYVQSFEGAFLPTAWTKLSPDGGSGWDQQAAGTTPIPGWNGGTITAPPGGENFVAFCTWNTGGPVSNDQWLVTPKMVNIQTDDYISFWLRYWPDSYNDTLEVRISTTDPTDPANFNVLVETLGFTLGSDTNWVNYSYVLSNFVSPGSDVYVAFRERVADNLNNGASFSYDLFGTNAEVDTGAAPLLPPANLTATANIDFVDLMWEAPTPPGTVELAYDDGTDEGNLSIGSTGEGDLAVRFTPNVYPSTVMAIKVHFAVAATGMTSIDWTIWDGTATGPATSLATGTQAINRGMFDAIDVSASGVQITADDFFISYYEPNGQTSNLSWDTDQPSADRSWVNAPALGLPWQTLLQTGIANFDNNLMIRALVLEGSGPNARVVELSPSGKSRPLSIAEIKQYKLTHKVTETIQLTGDVYLDGNKPPVTGAANSTQMTLQKPVSGEEVGSPLPLAKLSGGFFIEGLTAYNIYRSEDGTAFTNIASVDSTTTSYTDVGLTPATNYWYYVTAVYPEGESDPSDTVMVMTLSAAETIANHSTAEFLGAVTNKGNIGTLDDDLNGVREPGFQWPVGSNQLYEGAMMVGIAPDQVSDAARVISAGGQQFMDGDYQFLGSIDTLAFNADSTVFYTSYNDSRITQPPLADDGPNTPLPVEIHQITYSYTDANNSGYLIFKLEVTNTGTGNLNGVLVGMYHDWDINTFGTNTGEIVFVDVTIPGVNSGNPFPAEFARLYDAGNPFPYLGAVPLSQNVFRASRVASNANEIFPGGASELTEANKYGYMLDRRATNPFGPLGTPEDQSLVVGVGGGINNNPPDPGFDLGPGETAVVGIAIVGGNDAQDFVENGTAAMTKWVELGNGLLVLTAPVGIAGETEVIPTEFALEQNFPNPFNPTTTIKYALKENADVVLKIYNVLGQLVKTLVNEKQTAGFKTANWDGTNEVGVKVASGIYIYRIEANDFVQSRKMILMK